MILKELLFMTTILILNTMEIIKKSRERLVLINQSTEKLYLSFLNKVFIRIFQLNLLLTLFGNEVRHKPLMHVYLRTNLSNNSAFY